MEAEFGVMQSHGPRNVDDVQNLEKAKKLILPSMSSKGWLSNKEFIYNTGEAGDVGLISGSGRFLDKQKMATHSNVLARKIP